MKKNKDNNITSSYGILVEEEDEEEKKVNSTKPCDPNSPDYPWVPCGLDKEGH